MGQTAQRADISAVTNALPCVITTDAVHGYSTNDFIRLTDLNGSMPIPRGVDPLNNKKWKIIVTSTTAFSLLYPVTEEEVDSTDFAPYVSGGYCNIVQTEFKYL